MKVWFYSLLGLLLFCACAFATQSYVSKSAARLNGSLQKTEASLRLQHWGQTAAHLRQVSEKWQKTKAVWAIFLHHNEIDNIEQSLIKSREAVRCRDYTASAVELGNLKYFINHVPHREGLDLVNIF